MPSFSQNGRSMSESFDQHVAQRPAPSPTGSRQEGHSRGSATSSANRNGKRKAASAFERRERLASCMPASVTALGYGIMRENGSRALGKIMSKSTVRGAKG